MVKPTLLVLAAGMGSRYGSLKQMDGVGPNNEAIIDYSVYDAIRAGFGKVVFVIRHSFAKEFQEVFSPARFGGRIDVDFVFQELDYLPEGLSVPEGRVKPWGTNHAVMMAAEAIREPFAVINADDFYGAEAYKTIADYLMQLDGSRDRYCMVAYDLNKTLSSNGTVSRGVCGVDGEGNLTDSGKKPADFVAAEAGKRLMTDAEGEKLAGVSEGATKTAASSTNGNVNIDGKEVVVYTEPENVLHDEDVEDFSAEEIAALLAD